MFRHDEIPALIPTPKVFTTLVEGLNRLPRDGIKILLIDQEFNRPTAFHPDEYQLPRIAVLCLSDFKSKEVKKFLNLEDDTCCAPTAFNSEIKDVAAENAKILVALVEKLLIQHGHLINQIVYNFDNFPSELKTLNDIEVIDITAKVAEKRRIIEAEIRRQVEKEKIKHEAEQRERIRVSIAQRATMKIFKQIYELCEPNPRIKNEIIEPLQTFLKTATLSEESFKFAINEFKRDVLAAIKGVLQKALERNEENKKYVGFIKHGVLGRKPLLDKDTLEKINQLVGYFDRFCSSLNKSEVQKTKQNPL